MYCQPILQVREGPVAVCGDILPPCKMLLWLSALQYQLETLLQASLCPQPSEAGTMLD